LFVLHNKRKNKKVVKIKKKDNNNNKEMANSKESKLKGLDIIVKIEEKI